MSGYREHSFDPYAYQQAGPPLRPFNWVQWTGVALAASGIGLDLYFVPGALGLVRKLEGAPAFAGALIIFGVTLINSRRQPSTTTIGSEQLQRNRKVLLITIAACAMILGAAVTISAFTGA